MGVSDGGYAPVTAIAHRPASSPSTRTAAAPRFPRKPRQRAVEPRFVGMVRNDRLYLRDQRAIGPGQIIIGDGAARSA